MFVFIYYAQHFGGIRIYLSYLLFSSYVIVNEPHTTEL